MKGPLPDIPVTNKARRLAACALIGAGVAAGIGQVILLRELMNIAAGNELTIGLMLAGWFLWGAAGAGLVGWRAGKDTDAWQALRRVFRLASLPFYLLPASVVAVRVLPHRLSLLPPPWGVQMGEVMGLPHLATISLLMVLPAAAVAGAQFAASLALYARLQPRRGATGHAYALDALGHLAGGVLAAILLTRGIDGLSMVVVAGLAAFFGGCTTLYATPAYRVARVAPVAALLLALIVCFGTALVSRASPLRLKMQHPLVEVETPYGSLGVVEWGQDGVYFYVNGVPAFPSPPTPGIQHLVHFPMLQAPWERRLPAGDVPAGSRRSQVLLIGGGAAGGLSEVLQYGPQVQVDYVELDPGLIELARRYLVGKDRAALNDPRVRVWAMDGRLWVKRQRLLTPTPLPRDTAAPERGTAPYDVVILGVPEPMTAQINRFYTREFLTEVATIMQPEGVLGLQVPSSDTYLGDELLRLNVVLLRTVREVFPHVALLPGDPMVIAASRSAKLSEDAAVLRQRMDRLGIHAPEFRSHAWDRLFPFEVAQVKRSIDSAPPLPLNTDARPIGYFYGQAYWVAQHSRTSWAFFDWLSRLRLETVLWAVGLGFVVLLVPGLVSRRFAAGYVPFAIFGTGWIAMALEVTLLFAFQVYYGYVYQQLGIITGAFMVGLAWGARTAGREDGRTGGWEDRRTAVWRLMIATQLALAVEALLLPHILGGLSHLQLQSGLLIQIVFPLMTAAVGVAVGMQFPLATQLMNGLAAGSRSYDSGSRSYGPDKSAQTGARLYAADLIGACLGAAVAGAMLLPVLGLAGTCYSAAAVSLGLAALLWAAYRHR